MRPGSPRTSETSVSLLKDSYSSFAHDLVGSGHDRTDRFLHYRDAVGEMYRHCKSNNLTKVWAYLWNFWYSHPRWKLWAHSAYETSIPRKHTTMIVESLWGNLKRLVLHMYNRPPIDLVIYVIIMKVIPPYWLTLSEILTDSRTSRAASCSSAQHALKWAWERLQKLPLCSKYTTDVTQWTCNCGSQKYHANLLCKHLMQATGPLLAKWWPTAIRFHIGPFYTVPINGKIAPAPEAMCHHSWTLRMCSKHSAIVQCPVRHVTPTNTDDSDVDIPSVDGRRASSPVC